MKHIHRKHGQLLTGPEPIIRVVLYGTMTVIGLMTVLLLVSYALVGNRYVFPRLEAGLVAVAYVGVSFLFFKYKHHATAAWMLVVLYAVLGFSVLLIWGMNAPIGVLILGFTILVTGIMLGARYIIGTTIVVSGVMVLLQYASSGGLLHPDTSGLDEPSTYLDALSYCTIFIIFAVIAWLAGRRNEQLLRQSQKAEAALQREKDLLSIRLEQKTREVRAAQLEEMRQLYQFAELGQLGTVLLHDLANNLTALTLDIDDIGRQLQRNESLTRAKESIAYLETMVNGVRRQIHERDQPVVFDAPRTILETVAALGPKAMRAGVTLEFAPGSSSGFRIKGDPIRFTHILTILISNAIDAYKDGKFDVKSVIISTHITASTLVVAVSDHGKGIRAVDRDRLFKPFASTKPDGMGIGLFMAREMAEQHFHGSLELDENATATSFVLSVPRSRKKARADS